MTRLRRDVGIRNGRVAATHLGTLHRLGLEELHVNAFTLVLTDPAEAMGLPDWPRIWREGGHGSWSDTEIDRWEAALAPGAPPGFLMAVTYLVTSGVVREKSGPTTVEPVLPQPDSRVTGLPGT